MDWGDLAKQVVALGAPAIGAALGGPLGGAAGKILADALGVEATPAAVATAVDTPAAAPAVSQAEQEWIGKYFDFQRAQSDNVNATMRAELAGGQPWYAWRNLWGYSCVAEISATSMLILYELATGDMKAVTAFSNLTGFFITWYTMRLGVLGFIYNGANNEKIAAATGQVPGVIANVVKAVMKR